MENKSNSDDNLHLRLRNYAIALLFIVTFVGYF
jgi:hypothetical protein